MVKIPKAFIFAGANASGKSTFISTLYANNLLSGEFINPDKILKEELRLEENRENYQKAFDIAEKRREKCLREKRDIVIETVYSTQEKIDFVKQLKKEGYQTTLVFTGVENVQINALYLVARVMKGGHDVPIRKLIERRERSFANASTSLSLFDCAIFVDNSIPGETPVVLKSIAMGTICYIGDNSRELTWLDGIIQEPLKQMDESMMAQPITREHLVFCEQIRVTINDNFISTTEMSYEEVNASLGKMVNT
jgi:predicted ABC-type ATPase